MVSNIMNQATTKPPSVYERGIVTVQLYTRAYRPILTALLCLVMSVIMTILDLISE